jgi:hypothetical protein
MPSFQGAGVVRFCGVTSLCVVTALTYRYNSNSSILTTKCGTQSPLVELGQVASLVIACNSHLHFEPENVVRILQGSF